MVDDRDRSAARVCVVGAGPAGLAMARALKTAGLAFDVYERSVGVGGIWEPTSAGSPMYDSAHFIASRDAPASTFRGHPFPPGTAAYPAHAEVLAYLRGFAEAEGLMPHVHLSTPVEAAAWTNGAWQVRAGGEPRNYAALVCASGTLSEPVEPELPDADGFGGRIRHAVSYRSAEEVRGKRLLIVGGGNSGVDIACDAVGIARSVSLSMRRGYWFLPKFIAGMPTDMFFRKRDALPDWAHPPDAAALLRLLVGPQDAYGLEAPDHIPFAAHPIMNTEALHHMGHGRLHPRRAIARLQPGRVVYADGAVDDIDEIILATGYRATVPYLEPGLLAYENSNRPAFWLRLFHRSHPALFGLGFIETNSGVYRLFDLGAELIAKYIHARTAGTRGAAELAATIAGEAEPDLTGGIVRIASARHGGYVDSRTYERALVETTARYFGSA